MTASETLGAPSLLSGLQIGATLGSSTFGQVISARDARIVQLGLKLRY